MEYLVTGKAEVSVYIRIEAGSEEEAIEKANEEFGGITSYCGNGGMDKLIGVDGINESIDADGEAWFCLAEEI